MSLNLAMLGTLSGMDETTLERYRGRVVGIDTDGHVVADAAAPNSMNFSTSSTPSALSG
jgi:hypothetical protein